MECTIAEAVGTRHAELLATLFGATHEIVAAKLLECEPKDVVKFALAIIVLERRVHGLDRVRVEVTGKNGGPVEHEHAPDDVVDAELRAGAQRLLELAFGNDAAVDCDRPETSAPSAEEPDRSRLAA
jgi:hypothetical protein